MRAKLRRCLSVGRFRLVWFCCLWAASSTSAEQAVEVNLELPSPARLDLQDKETLLVAPLVVTSQDGEDRVDDGDPDVQLALARCLERVTPRETDLVLVEFGGPAYPVYELERLIHKRDFWLTDAQRSLADLILVGAVDLDVQDRSGYRVEEYTSPVENLGSIELRLAGLFAPQGIEVARLLILE